jgi:hypothetical protein
VSDFIISKIGKKAKKGLFRQSQQLSAIEAQLRLVYSIATFSEARFFADTMHISVTEAYLKVDILN